MKKIHWYIVSLFLTCSFYAFGQMSHTTEILLPGTSVQKIDVQVLNLNPTSNNCVPKPTKPCPVPRNGSFWIFGDGHYFDYETDNTGGGNTASQWITYSYSNPINEIVLATYFTEKYSNGDAPDPENTSGTNPYPSSYEFNKPTGTTSVPAPPFSTVIDTDFLVGLDTNHAPRPEYQSIYVVSAVAQDGDKLHFFFDNHNLSAGQGADYIRTREFLPYYFQKPLEYYAQSADFPTIPGVNLNDYHQGFTYPFDSVELDNSPIIIDSEREARLFFDLQTNGQLANNTKSKFLVILTDAFGDIKGNSLNPTAGMREWTMNVVLAHDPPSIKIVDICQCSNNQYKITYDLEMCNDGDQIATIANVDLQFPNTAKNTFQCLQVIKQPELTFSDIDQTNLAYDNWFFKISNLDLPQVVRPHTESHCLSIRFNVVVDESIISQLLTDKGIIKGHVAFDDGVKESFQTHPLVEQTDQHLIYDNRNHVCDPTNCKCKKDQDLPWYYWLIIALLLLFFFSIWRRMKKKDA